jgi:hypothetical protein
MRDLPGACVETVFLLACLQEWDNPGLRGKTLCAVDERTRCHPAVHEVREDATHRFAFEFIKRMLHNLSGRFQPWDTSRQFAARGYLSQSEGKVVHRI